MVNLQGKRNGNAVTIFEQPRIDEAGSGLVHNFESLEVGAVAQGHESEQSRLTQLKRADINFLDIARGKNTMYGILMNACLGWRSRLARALVVSTSIRFKNSRAVKPALVLLDSGQKYEVIYIAFPMGPVLIMNLLRVDAERAKIILLRSPDLQ